MRRFLLIFFSIMLTSCIIEDPISDNSPRFYLQDGLKMEWEETAQVYENENLISESHALVTMEHVGYEDIKGYHCFVFRITEKSQDGIHTGYQYLADTDTGLVLVNVTGEAPPVIWGLSPRIPGNLRNKDGKSYLPIFGAKDSLEQPQLTLSYPLYVGKDWTVFTEPWVRQRKVIGQEEISTPAGDFYTWVIKAWDPMYVWTDSLYDYITGEAWVKKIIVFFFYDPPTIYKFREIYELKNIDWGRK